jgi:peptidoglycan hydrolase CwlO-like protein
MTDNNKPIMEIPAAQNVGSHLPAWSPTEQLGAATGAILAAVLVFSWVVSRFRRDNAANNAEGSLYNNLSNQIQQLTTRISTLEGEKEKYQAEAAKLKLRVAALESVEEENRLLRHRLDQKDKDISELTRSLINKNDELDKFKERLHKLELKLAQDEKLWCRDCPTRPAHWDSSLGNIPSDVEPDASSA